MAQNQIGVCVLGGGGGGSKHLSICVQHSKWKGSSRVHLELCSFVMNSSKQPLGVGMMHFYGHMMWFPRGGFSLR